MRELFTNNNINRDGILLLDENISSGVKSNNENNLVLFEGSVGDPDSLGLGNFVAIRDEVDQMSKNGPVATTTTTIIEDSLTKSFKHKEYSIFKSMSLTSAINPGNNSSSPYHNNNYYYSNVHNYRNQFQQQRQLQPPTAPISLFNNTNNYTDRSFNQNLNTNISYMYYQNNSLKNNNYNSKRHTKMMPLNQTQQNKNKSSTNISSTSSLSSSSASSLKSTSNLQKSSSSSPFRRFNSFHNTNTNTRHFSMSPIQKQKTLQPTAKDFSLGQEQFDLIKSFFDKLQQYSYLKVKLVKQHMLASIINNEERRKTNSFTPQMNEDDVTRTLNLIDFDKDGLFNFENFCDYLNLFLANRDNLKEKLKSVIKAKRIFFESSSKSNIQNATSSFLSKEEIKQIVTFLDIFYNNSHSSENDAGFFPFDIDQSNDLDEFICLLSKRIEAHLFLQTP